MPRKYVPVPKVRRVCLWCGRVVLGNAKRRYCNGTCRKNDWRSKINDY